MTYFCWAAQHVHDVKVDPSNSWTCKCALHRTWLMNPIASLRTVSFQFSFPCCHWAFCWGRVAAAMLWRCNRDEKKCDLSQGSMLFNRTGQNNHGSAFVYSYFFGACTNLQLYYSPSNFVMYEEFDRKRKHQTKSRSVTVRDFANGVQCRPVCRLRRAGRKLLKPFAKGWRKFMSKAQNIFDGVFGAWHWMAESNTKLVRAKSMGFCPSDLWDMTYHIFSFKSFEWVENYDITSFWQYLNFRGSCMVAVLGCFHLSPRIGSKPKIMTRLLCHTGAQSFVANQ